MLNLIKPKFFMPVHGYQHFLRAHADTAELVGVPAKNIIIPSRGCIVVGDKTDGFKIDGSVPNEPLLVSGSGIGDVGTAVLTERTQLGNHGVVIVSALLDRLNNKIISGPSITTKGFVYRKTSEDILEKVEELSKEYILKGMKQNHQLNQISAKIISQLERYTKKRIDRNPAIVPVLQELPSPRRRRQEAK